MRISAPVGYEYGYNCFALNPLLEILDEESLYFLGFRSENYIGVDYLSVFISTPAVLFGLDFLSLHSKQSQPTSRAFYLPSLCETLKFQFANLLSILKFSIGKELMK